MADEDNIGQLDNNLNNSSGNNISSQFNVILKELSNLKQAVHGTKAAFPRAKFLCHISHALQSLLTDFCGIITVNLYSRTDTDEK